MTGTRVSGVPFEASLRTGVEHRCPHRRQRTWPRRTDPPRPHEVCASTPRRRQGFPPAASPALTPPRCWRAGAIRSRCLQTGRNRAPLRGAPSWQESLLQEW